MEKTFRITIEGRAYVVTVEDISTDGAQRLYPEPGSMKVEAPTTSAPAAPAPAAAAGAAAPAAGPGDELSPLAGVVKEIHVSDGQDVAEGDKLVSLEAMKMVTEVIATRAGKVSNVAVKPGDPVDAGQVLLRIT
ncbi:MAG: acetyl-CoA carboxylase biotin carboxyl carrier protein subunit [Geminicoccaceae bacterium]|nr:MAG: acetyl-CoA carboxylase biotin carboxyl carrier protein subunit [Geminicoccaceae bacterium]